MTKQRSKLILKRIAKQERIPVSQVKKEISEVIQYGLKSKKKDVNIFWNSVPKNGDIPTPEEVISHISSLL